MLLGDNPIRAVVGEAQLDEPAQVEGGGSVMEPVIIFADAAVTQFSVAASQPGDGAFDHGSVLAVFGLPVRVAGGVAGGALPGIVGTDPQGFALAVTSAAFPQWAPRACHAEDGISGAGDRSGQSVGAGRGVVVVVDGEVVDGEPACQYPRHRCRFDPIAMAIVG